MNHIKALMDQFEMLILDIHQYQKIKTSLSIKLDEVFQDYQKKRISYTQYDHVKETLLKSKPKSYWMNHYQAIIDDLTFRAQQLNKEIYKEIEFEITAKHLEYAQTTKELQKQAQSVKVKESPSHSKNASQKKESTITEPSLELPTDAKIRVNANVKVKPRSFFEEILHMFSLIWHWILSLFTPQLKQHSSSSAKATRRCKKFPRNPTDTVVEVSDNHSTYRSSGYNQTFGLSYLIKVIKNLFASDATTSTPQGEEEKSRVSIQGTIDERKTLTTKNLLDIEHDKLHAQIQNAKSIDIYNPKLIGVISNYFMKRLTYFLLDSFPDFFKVLYEKLRYAGVPVLSTTYVNIMLLLSLLSFIGIFSTSSLLLVIMGQGVILSVLKGLLYGLLVGILVFFGFYFNPFAKAKARQQSIEIHLPFAVNHLAAVATSGVPPANMFSLMAQSDEYGEVTTEIVKIVEHMEVFGFDLTTALRAVSSTTPSPSFQEFLDGIVSSVESGGNLEQYLKSAAHKFLDSYELQRKSYVEMIATISDIYTGIMIAAPLFFIVTFSLVSILGGTVGGFDVSTIIIFGTYIVIPAMNGLFLFYLQITSKEF